MKRFLKRFGATVAFVVVATVTASAQVPVYVFTNTDASGLVDEGTKRRQASVADVKRALGKKKTVIVVDADKLSTDGTVQDEVLLVEITGSALETTGKTNTTVTPGAFGPVATSKAEHAAVVRATLRKGDYTTDLVGTSEFISWSAAANGVASKVEQWVKMNVLAKP